MNFREFDQQSVFSGKFYTFSVKWSVFIRMFRGFFSESCSKLSKIVQIGKKGVFSADSPVTILDHFLPIFAQNALYALFNPKTRPWKFRKKPEKKGLSSIDRRNHFFNKLKKSTFFAIFIKWKMLVFCSFPTNLIIFAHFGHFWKKWVYHR